MGVRCLSEGASVISVGRPVVRNVDFLLCSPAQPWQKLYLICIVASGRLISSSSLAQEICILYK